MKTVVRSEGKEGRLIGPIGWVAAVSSNLLQFFPLSIKPSHLISRIYLLKPKELSINFGQTITLFYAMRNGTLFLMLFLLLF